MAVLAVFLPTSQGQPCYPAPDGLVSWWRGEADAGDSSSTNQGAWIGGGSFASGKVGQAFSFTGLNHVAVPASFSLNVQSLTIEGWVFPDDTSQYRPVVEYTTLNNDFGLHLWLSVPSDGSPGVTPGSVYANLGGGAGPTVFGTAGGVVPVNQWSHLALTYDRISGFARIYVNGLELATTNFGVISPATWMGLNLGLRGVSGQRFLGRMDEVSLYDRALSSAEIAATYLAGSSGKCLLSPTILTQPENRTVPAGFTASFAVRAVGAQPMTYHWQRSGSEVAVTSDGLLTLTNAQVADSGNYSVVVSNAAGFVVSSNAALTVVSTSCASNLPGLVGWWQGEGNVKDAVGGGDGTWILGGAYSPGQVGQAFELSGGAHLSIPQSPVLNVSNLTVEAWINPNAVDGYSPIVEYGSVNGGYGLHLWLSVPADGGFGVTPGSVYASLVGTTKFGTPGGLVLPGQWSHVALTYDVASGAARIYVNGLLGASTNFGTVTPATGADLRLGYRLDSGGRFEGKMDEVSIYNRALSAGEVESVFLAGSDGKCPQPPTILVQPQSQSIPVNLSATLAVQAVGSQPLTYHWRRGLTNLTTTSGPQLILPVVQLSDSGTYSVVVSNSAGFAVSSNAVLSVVPAVCTPAPTGLTSWWRGEVNADDSITTNRGSWFNGEWYAPGKVGQAFNFQATNRVVIPASLATSVQSLTLETWVFPNELRTYRPVVEYSDAAGNFGLHFWLSVPADGSGGFAPGSVYANLGGAGAYRFGTAAGAVPENQWTHLALTYDFNSGDARIYVNGTMQAATNFGSITLSTALPVLLGSRIGTPHGFLGLIDEVSFYNRALTAAEIGLIVQTSDGKCPLPPSILAQPDGRTVAAGTEVTLSVTAVGTQPLSYQWSHDGTNLPGATSPSLVLTNVQQSESGNYRVVVSNAVNAVTSSVAHVNVRYIFVFANGQPLIGLEYNFVEPVRIEFQSVFTNGAMFYTLDGSPPTIDSFPYTGPFTVAQSSVIRVLGYSADFLESWETAPIRIQILATFGLTASTPGGGMISMVPPGGPYPSNTVVSLLATPDNGWSFLGWTGDATGANPNVTVTMNRNKSVRAIFGTTLETTVAGGGSIFLVPPGGIYPYGTVVRLYAFPQAGSYFALWGNAASGNTSPLAFVVTNATPTVSSLFAALGPGQFTLTVVPEGFGLVAVNPQTNRYTGGTSVTLTAVPEPGQQFLGWSGDATGTNSPLPVVMNQSKTIGASFTAQPTLNLLGDLDNLAEDGVTLMLTGEFGGQYRIDGSTNLPAWTPLLTITNTFGSTQFTDESATNQALRFYRAVEIP